MNPKNQNRSNPKFQNALAPKVDAPMYSYTSVCCSVQATKTPCVKVGKKEALLQGLGSWRCSACRKSCACRRWKNPLDKETETQ